MGSLCLSRRRSLTACVCHLWIILLHMARKAMATSGINIFHIFPHLLFYADSAVLRSHSRDPPSPLRTREGTEGIFTRTKEKRHSSAGKASYPLAPPPPECGSLFATYSTLTSLRKFRIASGAFSSPNISLTDRVVGCFHPQASPTSFRGLLLWGAQAIQSAISGGAALVCRSCTASDGLSSGSTGRFVPRLILMPWDPVGCRGLFWFGERLGLPDAFDYRVLCCSWGNKGSFGSLCPLSFLPGLITYSPF